MKIIGDIVRSKIFRQCILITAFTIMSLYIYNAGMEAYKIGFADGYEIGIRQAEMNDK